MRIIYLPNNLDGPGFYRCLLPARELNRLGHQATTCPGKADTSGGWTAISWEAERIPNLKPDVVVFQMPLDRIVPKLIVWLQGLGIRVVVEVDDDYMHLPKSHPAEKSTSPLRPKNRDRNRALLFQSVRLADAVSVSTPALAEAFGSLNANVTVVRNFLDWRMWVDVPQQSEVTRRRTRVGWMGKMNRRPDDLEVLKPWLKGWLEANPEVEFVAAGDPSVHDFLGVPETQRVSTALIPFGLTPKTNGERILNELGDITACMDIGLVPLAPGLFNEGKSHLKGMEYAACGIPSVCSPTESYAKWWGFNDGCFPAASSEEWIHRLDVLVGDDQFRRRMGRAARAKAGAHAIQAHVSEWETFFGRVVRDQAGSERGDSGAGAGLGGSEGAAVLAA